MEVSNLTCLPRHQPSEPWMVRHVPTETHRAWMQQTVEKLKEVVKVMLATARGQLEEEMNLVDTPQRLGLAYHFEQEELDEALVRRHDSQVDGEGLHVVSPRFRLPRQEDCNVSSADEFNKFKDFDRPFQESLGSDI